MPRGIKVDCVHVCFCYVAVVEHDAGSLSRSLVQSLPFLAGVTTQEPCRGSSRKSVEGRLWAATHRRRHGRERGLRRKKKGNVDRGAGQHVAKDHIDVN